MPKGRTAVTFIEVNSLRGFVFSIGPLCAAVLPVSAGLFLAGCGTSIDTPFGRSPTDSVDFGDGPADGSGTSQPKPPVDEPRQTRYCFLGPDGEYTRAITMDRGHDDARDLEIGRAHV